MTSGDAPLSQRAIFKFFSPLALSWIFMAIEGPIAAFVLSHFANPKVQTAGFQVMFAFALFIESPVIDLLATSTTLSSNRNAYHQIRNFSLKVMFLASGVHALFCLTPLFDMVALGGLRLPVPVAEAARAGLIIMIPWSACIGWRRHLQGLLIRQGKTVWVGLGTAIRLSTMAGVALYLSHFGTGLSGIQVAASALMASVFLEAVAVHFASRSVVRTIESIEPETEDHLSQRRLAAFHFPLTATTMVGFIALPSFSWSLAQAPNGVTALAAFQVSSSLQFLFRAAPYALPEAIISLGRVRERWPALRTFALRAGLVCSAAAAIVSFSGLSDWFFRSVIGAQPEVADGATLALQVSTILPILIALQSYCRGMLTLHRFTTTRLAATAIGIVTLVVLLATAVSMRLPGVLSAMAAQSIAMGAELTVLYLSWRTIRQKSVGPAEQLA